MLRHAFDCAVSKRAKDDAIHPALEVVSDVAKLFSRVETSLRLIDKRSPAAHACHSCFESQARAKGGLLEEHHDLLTRQRCAEMRWACFHQAGKMKNIFDILRPQIANRNQVAAR